MTTLTPLLTTEKFFHENLNIIGGVVESHYDYVVEGDEDEVKLDINIHGLFKFCKLPYNKSKAQPITLTENTANYYSKYVLLHYYLKTYTDKMLIHLLNNRTFPKPIFVEDYNVFCDDMIKEYHKFFRTLNTSKCMKVFNYTCTKEESKDVEKYTDMYNKLTERLKLKKIEDEKNIADLINKLTIIKNQLKITKEPFVIQIDDKNKFSKMLKKHTHKDFCNFHMIGHVKKDDKIIGIVYYRDRFGSNSLFFKYDTFFSEPVYEFNTIKDSLSILEQMINAIEL